MKFITARLVDDCFLSVLADLSGTEVVIDAELFPGFAPHILEASCAKTGKDALPEVLNYLDDVNVFLKSAASEFATAA